MSKSTDLRIGFHIDVPDVFVPWGICQSKLLEMLEAGSPDKKGIRKVTGSYYCVNGKALGLECTIGFHFKWRKLSQIEIFDPNQKDLAKGFARFQGALVNEFGEPTRSKSIGDDFPAHEWKFGSIRILHFMQERFGEESRLRLLAPKSSFAYDPFG